MLERTSSDPVLRLEGLRKNFGSLTVTDDVTLDVMPGEMHAIIGPNGAGKTTLINQISGII
jgi:branched-chain amino acid transport system ATP-binding protein